MHVWVVCARWWLGTLGFGEETMGRKLTIAIGASVLVAALLTFSSMTLAEGDWASLISQPGFWAFFAKTFIWLFVAAVAASLLTLIGCRAKGERET